MTTPAGQLREELVHYTAILFYPPEWIKNWSSRSSGTEFISLDTQQTLIIAARCVERSFARSTPFPLLRFAYETSADRLDALMVRSPYATETPIEAVQSARAEQPDDEPISPVVLVSQILDWLQVTYEQLAQMTGVSRSALFHWRKTGVTPRTSHARQVLRVHSLASLIVRRFGTDGARRWLHADGTAAWDYLKAGDIEQAEQAVRTALFGQKSPSSRGGRTISEEVDVPIPTGARTPLKRAARGSKRGRPGQS